MQADRLTYVSNCIRKLHHTFWKRNMTAETDLNRLLARMQPKALPGEYVYCTVHDRLSDVLRLDPIATCQEEEGLSLLLERSRADRAGFDYSTIFCGITLSVYSSLVSVGFTAAVASELSAAGIPCNFIAAHHHDHIFVPCEKAEQAMRVLIGMGK